MRNGPEDVEYEFASGGCRVDPLLKADQIDLSGLGSVAKIGGSQR